MGVYGEASPGDAVSGGTEYKVQSQEGGIGVLRIRGMEHGRVHLCKSNADTA